MKNFLFIALTFAMLQANAQASMLVFKPTVCTVSELDTVYEIKTENRTAFAFDFKSKILYFVDSYGDWTENIVESNKTEWPSGYTTIDFLTPTAHYELWLYPINGSVKQFPMELFEFPLGGPVTVRQFSTLTNDEK